VPVSVSTEDLGGGRVRATARVDGEFENQPVGRSVGVRDVVGAVLLAAGALWLLITVLAAADVLSRTGGLDVRALVGMLAVGGLAVTWGWLLAGARR
jgi:hypothetical protein